MCIRDSYRTGTPNSRGQYSDSLLSSLESQNDEALAGMSAKVRMLKDITVAIGGEIRDSTAMAEKMNEQFEGTRTRLKGTMRRMLRMAERTGVGGGCGWGFLWRWRCCFGMFGCFEGWEAGKAKAKAQGKEEGNGKRRQGQAQESEGGVSAQFRD